MSVPIVPDQGKARIRRNVQKMADAGASQEEIEAYLAHEGVAPKAPSLGVTKKEELPDTTAGGAIAPDEEESGYGHRLVTTVLNAAQGIPGMEALEAGAGALGSKFTDSPLSYQESLDALRHETDKIPTGRKVVGKMLGSAPILPFLPTNPAAAGAVLGGADELLDAEPESVGARVGKTALGAGVGAATGRAADLALTGARTALAKPTSKVLASLIDERAASAGPKYAQAFREGAQNPSTPMVKNFLNKPDIQEIVAELQSTRPFQGVAADDPKLLDAIYKVLSDRSALAQRQAEAVTPSRPNIGRFRQQDIKLAQQDALDAISGGSSLPGPMPSYRGAVQDFAEKSRGIKAVERGHDALRSRLNRNLPMAKSLKKTSVESFEDFLANASDDEKAKAAEGILSGIKGAFGQSVRKSGIKALREAPAMLRKTGSSSQIAADRALRSLLLAISAGT